MKVKEYVGLPRKDFHSRVIASSVAFQPSTSKCSNPECEHFGERLIFTEINGKGNVATFRTTAKTVLQQYYDKQQEERLSTDEEKIKIVLAASKIIKEDI